MEENPLIMRLDVKYAIWMVIGYIAYQYTWDFIRYLMVILSTVFLAICLLASGVVYKMVTGTVEKRDQIMRELFVLLDKTVGRRTTYDDVRYLYEVIMQ
jgi:hypothetical protein